jgi:hypothetical protein
MRLAARRVEVDRARRSDEPKAARDPAVRIFDRRTTERELLKEPLRGGTAVALIHTEERDAPAPVDRCALKDRQPFAARPAPRRPHVDHDRMAAQLEQTRIKTSRQEDIRLRVQHRQRGWSPAQTLETRYRPAPARGGRAPLTSLAQADHKRPPQPRCTPAPTRAGSAQPGSSHRRRSYQRPISATETVCSGSYTKAVSFTLATNPQRRPVVPGRSGGPTAPATMSRPRSNRRGAIRGAN